MRQLVAEQGLAQDFVIDSAGTSGWHNGEDMHRGTAKILDQLHIDHHDFVSSEVQDGDAQAYDYVVAMDGDNLRELERRFGRQPHNMFVITDLVSHLGYQGVPDPWYTHDFGETQRLLQDACAALFMRIQSAEAGK